MVLTEQQKEAITKEYNSWFDRTYGNKTLEERKKLGAFFTPPELTIKMIEKFESIENKTILDPTCGSGNLLVACILAGANPKMIYGNELDEEFLNLAKERLIPYGVPEENLHQGDVLKDKCLDISTFTKDYNRDSGKQVDLW